MDCNLAELPEGWAWTTYEQIGKWSGGGTPSKQIDSYWIGGEIPWISPKDMKSLLIYDSEDRITDDAIKSSSAKLIPSDSLLFVVRSGILRRILPVALTRIDAAVNQDLKALTPSDHIFADYLLYHALAFNNEIRRSCSKDGTTVESIEFFALKEYPIPLAPLPEQHRIVARIEELFSRLDAGVEALRRAKAQLQRYRQSVLQAAVEGRLTAEWREAHPEVEPAGELLESTLRNRKTWWKEQQLNKKRNRLRPVPNDSCEKNYKEPFAANIRNLPTLPEGWTWATWDQISNWVTYGFTKPMPHVEDGFPIITAKNVINRIINISNADRTTRDAFESLSNKDRPQSGDILITKDGTIGRAALVNNKDPFCINQKVAVIWLRSCTLNRHYLLEVIESPIIQKPIWKKARGVAIQHLSITDFAKMPFPMPPIDEQNQIVEESESRFSLADNIEKTLEENIAKAKFLHHTILKRAFQGKLVPQDPNDEPASLLLERIRAERIKESPRRGRKSNIHQARLAQ